VSFRDPLDIKKAGDVASTALKLRDVLPCGICALGIAADIVEHHWHGASVDWKSTGHVCRLTTDGLKPEELVRVTAIDDAYSGKERAS
jgi:hypothetical protein